MMAYMVAREPLGENDAGLIADESLGVGQYPSRMFKRETVELNVMDGRIQGPLELDERL